MPADDDADAPQASTTAGGPQARHQDAHAIERGQLWWRRLLAEAVGTALLVLAAAGAPAVDALSDGRVGRVSEVTAPGLTVAALILAIGASSGAHFNPVVTFAFALRREFPWARVPGYLAAQTIGAIVAAALVARLLRGAHAKDVVPSVGLGLGPATGLVVEALLTFGLVTVILGTASGAQNVGHLSAVAVGAYITLAGMWASPTTGAGMNPLRFLGPAIFGGHLDRWPVYVVGPLIGSLAAVAVARALRGQGGDPTAKTAGQGDS